jgi:uncharacterized protein
VNEVWRDHGIFEGTVGHHRHDPEYGFTQKISMAYLNLSTLDTAFHRTALLGTQWWRPACFDRRDYYGEPTQRLDVAINDVVEAELGFRPDGDVGAVMNLRTFGWCFNPIVIYWCFDTKGSLVAQVLGVTNTPWHEYHNYVLDRRGHDIATLEKAHHVSPFFPMGLTYDVTSSLPAERLDFALHVANDAGQIFEADLHARRRPLDTRGVATMLATSPTQKVSLGIYARALTLWRRGATFVPHPDKLARKAGGAS